VSEAWFGFLGVIVGALVSLFGEQISTRREREARQALRNQERKDRRDAFQRDAILALQDAIAEYERLASVASEKALARGRETGRRTVLTGDEAPLPDGYSAAYMRVTMLRARMFDDDLRRVVSDLQHRYSHMVSTTDPDVVREYTLELIPVRRQMEERINVLLKNLF
jgi:hypothetical protein